MIRTISFLTSRINVLKYCNHHLGWVKTLLQGQSLFKEVSMSPKKDTQTSATSTTAINKKVKGFTDEERAAMKERAQELKAAARADKDKADGESAVLAKIAEMPEPDRTLGERLH